MKKARRLGEAALDTWRSISTSRVSKQALAARTAAAEEPKGKGLLSWFQRKKKKGLLSDLPTLYEPLPGVKLPLDLDDGFALPVETKITKLANGLTVASENTMGPTATIGVYVDSGSSHETPFNSGVSHILERMAFKSTRNRTHLRLVREAEAIGGNVLASASREQMSYTGDVIRSFVPEIVELLADSIRNPAFHDWEIKEQVDILREEIQEMAKDPQAMLLEALHPAGYKGPLGKALVTSESSLDRIDSRALHEFVAANYTASRMVFAGSGVEHDYFLSLVKPLFEDMPLVAPPEPVKSEYVGGEWRLQGESDTTSVSIAFEIPGGWRNERDAVMATVLQSLLGGGGSFSSGGPGKGVHSRLYTRVLAVHPKVENFTAFTSVYNDTGLFGIHASSEHKFVGELVDLIGDELISVAEPGEVDEIELERAKNATVSLVLMNLESRVVVNEDIGRQILTYGCRKPAKEFIDTVRELTLDDIRKVAEKIISTPVTMACYGDVKRVPLLDKVSSQFQ
ncbi:hypothetical protein SELMODRAFT_448827 [Selaginella moellendorffii]|uniref:Alpha-MPP n=1 Tax=Selaginella moellendorffii TaxID=88036 RepID=D8TAH5_SELML|nr:mitochondrial-processing peptidase subunit alpha [Selaginella moellendorffii]EFJ06291.1 hypothetical protein SELMODRAFT_448827 [Selaginella moellendorffii]|eukprot:XP_002992589.1 mitochondrial-processing peptidase subunit alpha [Selaginella moellendorffii]